MAQIAIRQIQYTIESGDVEFYIDLIDNYLKIKKFYKCGYSFTYTSNGGLYTNLFIKVHSNDDQYAKMVIDNIKDIMGVI